jgi:hypothetical protein
MIIIEQLCPRVRGFAFGYRFELSPDEKDHLTPEFIRGWHEGVDLLFDERRAEAESK